MRGTEKTEQLAPCSDCENAGFKDYYYSVRALSILRSEYLLILTNPSLQHLNEWQVLLDSEKLQVK